MVDRKGGRAEGMIPKDKMNKFKDNFQEGVVYTIQRFQILKAREQYTAVDHLFRISFVHRTLALPVTPQHQDVVDLITAVKNVLPPTGGTWEPRRQVIIAHGQKDATVTLWGNFADAFDAHTLPDWSKREHILVFLLETFIYCTGTMAFKSTSSTRWHVNVEIPGMKATPDHLTLIFIVTSIN